MQILCLRTTPDMKNLWVYRKFNDDHAPTLDQIPYTIDDIKNLYQTFNELLHGMK